MVKYYDYRGLVLGLVVMLSLWGCSQEYAGLESSVSEPHPLIGYDPQLDDYGGQDPSPYAYTTEEFTPMDSGNRSATNERFTSSSERFTTTESVLSQERTTPRLTTFNRTYVVRRGDTLWSIAVREYGSGQRWRDIAEANPNLNPTKLRIGQQIILP